MAIVERFNEVPHFGLTGETFPNVFIVPSARCPHGGWCLFFNVFFKQRDSSIKILCPNEMTK